MTNPFDYVNAVTSSKKDMMRGTENDELAEKGYNPYLTNRSLSYHQDCILYVNELNRFGDLDNLLQFDFLLNSLRPKKRYAKWIKPEQNEDLESVMEYFGYSRVKAERAMIALTKEQITMIKEKNIKGGNDGGLGRNGRSDVT